MSDKPDLQTAMANVSALLELAQWHMLDSMGAERHRYRDEGPVHESYRVPKREADQIVALLIVTHEYAERIVAAHAEGGAA